MKEAGAEAQRRPRVRPLAVIATVAGVLLFIYTLQTAGPREIARQLRQVGIGFLVVLVLSAIRMAVRAKAWSLCVEEHERFTFAQAFKAFVAGDAVGTITPLGPLGSEGAKALLEPPHHSDVCGVLLGRPRKCLLQHQRRDHGDDRHARVSARLSPDKYGADHIGRAWRCRHRLCAGGVVAVEQPAATPQPLPHTCRRSRRRRQSVSVCRGSQGARGADPCS